MVLHPDPLLDRTRMYKHLSPRPPYPCSMKRDLSFEHLASTDLAAGFRKPCAHAHAGSGRVDRKENCTGAQSAAQVELENFFEFF